MIHGVAPESLSEVFSGVPGTKEFTPEDFIFDRDPEDFAEQLTSLSLLLHRQLNTVERRRKDTSLLSRLQEFPLESIFESTQKLVSIVEEVAGNPIWLARFDSSPEETGQPMLCTPSELSIDHFENISTINSTQSLPLSHCTSTLPVNSDHPDPPSMDSSPCVNSSRVSSFDSATRSSNVDILVVLMFLTCHVYLSRLYESFHCDLEQYSLLPPQASTRRVFWHLNLGSFCAIEGLGLEVALVAQVSSLMLERLQQAHKSCTEAGLITPELIKAVEMQDAINGI
ncbi:hypothetical protein GTA08_BOTSDO09618 [Neofusicoccum parvum]|uniref:Uncharacterized protein n=1 Tax=Neofusicoccum parvum TaxID=310453 RepID=A0ACB5RNX2_9PEZI|nr:hypothetical protein GTA08_BOTSDO09618 [Neofusicoccum parvum]